MSSLVLLIRLSQLISYCVRRLNCRVLLLPPLATPPRSIRNPELSQLLQQAIAWLASKQAIEGIERLHSRARCSKKRHMWSLETNMMRVSVFA